MQIGLMVGASPGPDSELEGLIDLAKRAEQAGFARLAMANIFGLEAISSLAVAGHETSRIELGTAVVPTYPRHPTVMAQQALTAQVASGGRFVLGIGLSHKVVIEDMLGYSYDRPARHMREYLEVLMPLLRGEGVKYDGEHYKVAAQLQVPDAKPVPVLVAALGPVMLRLSGRLADGTITWMTGPKTLSEHTGPVLRESAASSGRPEPRVVAGIPVVLTRKVEEARKALGQLLQVYGTLPSYRAMLDREGLANPEDIALVGDESTLRDGMGRYRDAGVTDFDAALLSTDEGAFDRTFEFLASQVSDQ